MHSKLGRQSRSQRPSRKPKVESLEKRLVFSITLASDDPPWESRTVFTPHDDGVVIARDSEVNEIEILENDFSAHYPRYHHYRANFQPPPTDETPALSRAQVLAGLKLAQPDNGSVDVSDDGVVCYTPDAGFLGIDTFTYSVTVGDFAAELNVSVNVVEPLFSLGDWFRVDENSQNNILDVLDNDGLNAAGLSSNPNDRPELAIVAVETTGPQGTDMQGIVEISADGKQLIYVPAQDTEGLEQFRYTVRDSDGYESEALVQVQVTTLDPFNPNQTWNEQIELMLLETAIKRDRANHGRFKLNEVINDHVVVDDVFWRSASFALSESVVSRPVGLDQDTGHRDMIEMSFASGNNQELGVEEGNLVQTDGEYLYSITRLVEGEGGTQFQMIVMDVRDTSNLSVVARYTLDSPIDALHLSQNRITLLSQSDESIVVSVLDVADPTLPTLVYRSTISGRLNQSRAIGDHVYVIADAAGRDQLPVLQQVCYDVGNGCFFETVSQYVDRVSESIRDSIAAKVETVLEDGSIRSESAAIAYPLSQLSDLAPFKVSTIVSLDVSDDGMGPSDLKSILHESRGDIYVSAESIFFVDQFYGDFGASASVRRMLGSPVVELATNWAPPRRMTRIEKVRFDEQGQLSLVASGTVEGHVLNSFSISEHDGDLRIATNTFDGNHLYVLQQNGIELTVTGRVEGLARGEQIYSVRFEGDRGYVVTFRKVDPLFIFDLSDASDPKLVGELKVTGYSNYLHLIDENYLLGIGRDTDSRGLFQELQVSLFDITDPENPKLKHRYSFEGGRNLWSPLVQDAWNLGRHQSVSYFASHQTLVIPVYQGDGRNWSWQRSGADAEVSMRVLEIDPDEGIAALGSVDFEESFNPKVARSVRIGDALLSLSPQVVRSHEFRNPSQQLDELRFTTDWAVERDVEPELDPSPDDAGLTASFVEEESQTRSQKEATDASQGQNPLRRVWHNRRRPMDVDDDGEIRLSDLLRVINFLSRHGASGTATLERVGSVENASSASDIAASDIAASDIAASDIAASESAMVDVNNDGHVTPKDVLQMINHFRRQCDADHVRSPLSDEVAVDVVMAEISGS